MEKLKKKNYDFEIDTDLFDDMIQNVPPQPKEKPKEKVKVIIKDEELEQFNKNKNIKRY
jgi:hypothetical protein